jgi:hypothetical protein
LTLGSILAIKQTVTVKVTGFDPAKPDLGVTAPIANAFVRLTGTRLDFEPPKDFNPTEDDLKDFTTPVLQGLTRKINADGEAVFDDLPPLKYIVEAKKFGYLGPQTLMVPNAARVLPDVHFHPVDVDSATKIEVVVTSPYATPEVLAGLEVKLEGLDGEDGTNTKGIERVMPLMIVPPDPGLPFGGGIALFEGLLPGRYRAHRWTDSFRRLSGSGRRGGGCEFSFSGQRSHRGSVSAHHPGHARGGSGSRKDPGPLL